MCLTFESFHYILNHIFLSKWMCTIMFRSHWICILNFCGDSHNKFLLTQIICDFLTLLPLNYLFFYFCLWIFSKIFCNGDVNLNYHEVAYVVILFIILPIIVWKKSVLDPQVLIEGSLTSLLFVHQWILGLEELRGFS